MEQQTADFIQKAFTDAQWYALIFSIAGTMSLTQIFKNVFFGFVDVKKPRVKKAILYLAVGIFGAIVSYVGYRVGIPKQPDWFWVLSGCVSGMLSIATFKLLIEMDWIGSILNALGLQRKPKDE